MCREVKIPQLTNLQKGVFICKMCIWGILFQIALSLYESLYWLESFVQFLGFCWYRIVYGGVFSFWVFDLYLYLLFLFFLIKFMIVSNHEKRRKVEKKREKRGNRMKRFLHLSHTYRILLREYQGYYTQVFSSKPLMCNVPKYPYTLYPNTTPYISTRFTILSMIGSHIALDLYLAQVVTPSNQLVFPPLGSQAYQQTPQYNIFNPRQFTLSQIYFHPDYCFKNQ